MDYIDWVESDAFSEEGPALDGFIEEDEFGVTHHVQWELSEVAPDQEYETWWCTTHDRLYYGGCNKVDQPYGR